MKNASTAKVQIFTHIWSKLLTHLLKSCSKQMNADWFARA